ncbi:MAG: hypothetical protein ABIU05_13960 [Nitrospirales bacterium]
MAQLAIRGGTAEMDSLSARDIVLHPHDTAKKRTEPYTNTIDELPTMRRDAVNLVNQSIEEKRQAYVLMNNRSEGNVPLTVQTLVERPQTDP